MEIKKLLDRFISNDQSPKCLLPGEAASKSGSQDSHQIGSLLLPKPLYMVEDQSQCSVKACDWNTIVFW